ncbi:Immunoglobulin-like fold [Phytophthora cinnamomi]|uniref:Immunoglobulin-like fold n=1 Tax=Phytophthora cinnamomi TaxID=4785 RepID=UPI00355A3D04|nr:Immunoglobulin-like fold [Phytophthora cinnamomi]
MVLRSLQLRVRHAQDRAVSHQSHVTIQTRRADISVHGRAAEHSCSDAGLGALGRAQLQASSLGCVRRCWSSVRAQLFTPRTPGPPEKLVSPRATRRCACSSSRAARQAEGVNGAPVLGYRVSARVDEAQSSGGGGRARAGRRLPRDFANARGSATTSCVAEREAPLSWDGVSSAAQRGEASAWRARPQRGKNGLYTVTFDGAYLVSGPQPTARCATLVRIAPNRALSFEGAHTTTGVPGFYPEVWRSCHRLGNAQVLAGTFDLSVGFES